MLNMDTLRAFGADAEEGLRRCVNNEGLYFRLVNLTVKDPNFQALPEALAQGDLKAGFEAAHALKGVLANLSLTPILAPVVQITELLRGRVETDYQPYLDEIAAQRAKLEAMIAE